MDGGRELVRKVGREGGKVTADGVLMLECAGSDVVREIRRKGLKKDKRRLGMYV